MSLHDVIRFDPVANAWKWRAIAYRDALGIAKCFVTDPIVLRSFRSSMRFSAKEAVRAARWKQNHLREAAA